jgi:hypothetical protein
MIKQFFYGINKEKWGKNHQISNPYFIMFQDVLNS